MRQGFCVFHKRLRVISGIHLFAFGRVEAFSCSYSLVFFLSWYHTNTIIPFWTCCVLSLCVLRAFAVVPDQPKKTKSCSTEHLFTFPTPPLFSSLYLFISRSTHSHSQLPRRRGPLPGDACWRKRTRPLPEGQREPGGQAPREDVTGNDGEGRGKKGRK